MVSTNYLICYDVTEDAIRASIAGICKSVGLERIQYSVFYGKLSSSQLSTVKLEIGLLIKDSNSNVHFIKVCSACEKDHTVLISLELELMIDEEKASKLSYQRQDNSYAEISQEIEFNDGVIVL